MTDTALLDLVPEVAAIANEAGLRIMEIYNTDFDVAEKDDRSPVTEADTASEDLILPMLEALTPGIPIVSEEEVDSDGAPDISGGFFWLVDPLDGTKEFVNKRDEFTVNIALVAEGVPVLGVLAVPAKKTVYTGCGLGTAMMVEGDGQPRMISARQAPEDGVVVVASRSHGDTDLLDEFLADYTVAEQVSAGSAVKFALVADGQADLYPRFGRTMEWDTAAGHAILLAAGGSVETVDGAPLIYGKPGLDNPHFIAYGRRE